jgi:hypothetical protein
LRQGHDVPIEQHGARAFEGALPNLQILHHVLRLS